MSAVNPTKLGQKGGSRTDTLIKLVLIFFISLLSFSVGTFVGKQFSDSQHKMAALESEYSEGGSRETASVPADSLEVKPEEALTDKDIQKIAEEFTKPEGDSNSEAKPEPIGEHGDNHAEANAEDRHVASADAHKTADEHVPAPAVKAAAHAAKEEHHAAEPSEAAEKVASGHAPSENKPVPTSHMPANLPSGVAASSIGKYTVQISSHQSESEAEHRATELKGKGFSAFVVPATVNGKQWYRVSVGLFDKMTEAKVYREKLLKEASVASAFVQKIVQ